MTKTATSNYGSVGSPGSTFNARISADSDPPDRNDIDALGHALENHNHASGKGLVVARVVASAQSYTPNAGATATLDLSLGNVHDITMPAGNITIALSNETTGQIFQVSLTQDSVGSRTVTWFTTIRWAGGSAPTLTTTANKRDVFVFKVTGSGTYDGFIAGQNI